MHAGQRLREHSDELMEPVKETALAAAHEVRDELKEPVANAVELVKGTAQDAVSTTTEHAQHDGRETADGLRQAGHDTTAKVRNAPRTQPPPAQG
ncbi:hypothetical protein [Streptomyces sp. NPDC054854]